MMVTLSTAYKGISRQHGYHTYDPICDISKGQNVVTVAYCETTRFILSLRKLIYVSCETMMRFCDLKVSFIMRDPNDEFRVSLHQSHMKFRVWRAFLSRGCQQLMLISYVSLTSCRAHINMSPFGAC